MHEGEEGHARPGWTTSRRGQDAPWKSQSEWQRTGINGESTSIVWPTLGSRTAKDQIRSGVLAWLSVWARCRFAYGPSDSTATHCLLLQRLWSYDLMALYKSVYYYYTVKSRLLLPFWYRLTRVVPDKGPLNRCVCVCMSVHVQMWSAWRMSTCWSLYSTTAPAGCPRDSGRTRRSVCQSELFSYRYGSLVMMLRLSVCDH